MRRADERRLMALNKKSAMVLDKSSGSVLHSISLPQYSPLFSPLISDAYVVLPHKRGSRHPARFLHVKPAKRDRKQRTLARSAKGVKG